MLVFVAQVFGRIDHLEIHFNSWGQAEQLRLEGTLISKVFET